MTDTVPLVLVMLAGGGLLAALAIWGQPSRDRFQAWVARQQDTQRDR